MLDPDERQELEYLRAELWRLRAAGPGAVPPGEADRAGDGPGDPGRDDGPVGLGPLSGCC